MTQNSGCGEGHFALDDVKVRMTDAARAHANERFSRTWLWNRYPLDIHRSRYPIQDSRCHHLGTHHDYSALVVTISRMRRSRRSSKFPWLRSIWG